MIDTEKNPGLAGADGSGPKRGAGWKASRLVIAGGIVALAGALFLYFYYLDSSGCATCGPSVQQQATTTDAGEDGVGAAGGAYSLAGVVTANDKSQVPVDGPGFVVVRLDNGELAEVIYSCGMMPVANPESSAVGWDLAPGDRIEAYGAIVQGDVLAVSICEKKDYYLRKASL